MVFLITYDLNKPGQDYPKLYKSIQSLGEYQHPLESVWFVSTDKSAQEIYNILRPSEDTNDFIFITQIETDYWGYMPTAFWPWLKPII